ncbi:hypothetical protein D9619_011109 [Psilocybe cf. subviscida]|uniref:Uncharacterized protein n=1 Tax=Psilocybe cf. subviscida TaxID=2480587 RepID=A0A8H5BJN4_9AGAR|nr:hypothetical protein D9619_011109 [Psilocybe cf. subviscida]
MHSRPFIMPAASPDLLRHIDEFFGMESIYRADEGLGQGWCHVREGNVYSSNVEMWTGVFLEGVTKGIIESAKRDIRTLIQHHAPQHSKEYHHWTADARTEQRLNWSEMKRRGPVLKYRPSSKSVPR